MKTKIIMNAVYAASGDVVVRKVEDAMIIIPFATGADNAENEPYSLNPTGQIIWQRLDGQRSLKNIVKDLAVEFKMPVKVIEKDVIEFVEKLLERKMLVKVLKT
jgi:hypothetical protein